MSSFTCYDAHLFLHSFPTRRSSDLPRPWKMPLWPAPPIIGLVGCVVALSQQKPADLLTIGVLFAAGAIYYFVWVRPHGDRYWNVQINPQLELEKLAHHDSVEPPAR